MWLPSMGRGTALLVAASAHGPQNFRPSADTSDDCTGNLRAAEASAPRIDRDFSAPQSKLRRLDLHFNIPAKIRIAKSESLQSLPADNSQRAEVGELNSPDPSNQPGGQPVPEVLHGCERSRFSLSRNARAHDHVPLSLAKSCNQSFHIPRCVGQIRVHEHHCGDLRPQMGEASLASVAITSARLPDNLRAGIPRRLSRTISAPVVHDDDLGEQALRYFQKLAANGFLFVECRNDQGDRSVLSSHVGASRVAFYQTHAQVYPLGDLAESARAWYKVKR